eukprot:TRINITY_DN2133_c0_g1_i1.p1 TRINITY_DN2133_c0_g1~~TRINITY_DN2133_c0_g1_i1.p1  ORF type:complete len:1063 (-),score=160.59 TRINITY_DN2133_c0_g1_i1:48-3236(-)
MIFNAVACVTLVLLFDTAASQTYRINCGGPNFTDPSSNRWVADTPYANGGSTSTFTGTISNTNVQTLYLTERWGTFAYLFPITQERWFDVDLMFAEVYDGTSTVDSRVFRVMSEGETILNNFDIVALAGFRTAYIVKKTLIGCGSTLDITLQAIKENPKISAIYVRPSTNSSLPAASSICSSSSQAPVAPTTAKYSYSEVLHKIWLYYESQRSGDISKATIRRLSWRRNSAMDVSNVNGNDLSGGYYESSNRMKFGLPLAATWTFIAWGFLEYPSAYERTGETMYLKDAIKWATDYFIKAHPSAYEFYGQIGNSDPDFTYCGPPEEYNLNRPTYKLTTTNRATEIVCETAAAMASASLVFRNSNATYADLLLAHARQLYTFGVVYNGTVATSIPNHQSYYPSNGYQDEIAWAGIWLYKATGEEAYLTDAINRYELYYNGYPGFSLNWGEKGPGIAILLAQITEDPKYTVMLNNFFKNWLPGPDRSIPVTPKGLSFQLEWGSLRYSANSAFLAIVFADYLRTQDLSDPMTREYVVNSPSYNLFNWAVSQINYILGDSGRSYMIGFGSNYPVRAYHLPSWAPTIDFPYRGGLNGGCAAAFGKQADGDLNRMIAYGAIVGGPNIQDYYPDWRGNNWVFAEPTQDYTALFSGAVAKLVDYYNLGPFCGNLNLGWDHPNGTFGGWTPRGLKNQTIYCQPGYNSPLTTGVVPSGYSSCRLFHDFRYSTEGFFYAAHPDGAQTGLSWLPMQQVTQLTWNKAGTKTTAWWEKDLFDGTKGIDLRNFNTMRFKLNLVGGSSQISFYILFGSGWEYQASKWVQKEAGSSTVDIFFTGLTTSQLNDVRTLGILFSPDFDGAGSATIDDISFCVGVTTAPVTTIGITTKSLTTRQLTTKGLTTQALTTKEITTAQLTTQPLTTKPLTTRPLTSGALTSGALTTRASPPTPTTRASNIPPVVTTREEPVVTDTLPTPTTGAAEQAATTSPPSLATSSTSGSSSTGDELSEPSDESPTKEGRAFNTVAVAVGVAVPLVVLSSIVGVFLFIRQKRHNSQVSMHERNTTKMDVMNRKW